MFPFPQNFYVAHNRTHWQQYEFRKTEIVLGQLNKNKCHKIPRHFA